MTESFLDGAVTFHPGDCREVLRAIPDCSIDSVVTDPPYALVSSRSGSAGFMRQKWDTGETAFSIEFWREVHRVLKPGGHVAAFSGTRTYHRIAIAVDDGGFEIRDQLAWIYGNGFSKSRDVPKAIDKHNGEDRPVVGVEYLRNDIRNNSLLDIQHDDERDGYERAITIPASEESAAWEGWGTALKPAWEPIVLARKPLVGTVAENVLKYGTGALNIDGCRVPHEEILRTGAGKLWSHYRGREGEASADRRYTEKGSTNFAATPGPRGGDRRGRLPANIIHDGSEEVVSAFPEAPGALRAVGPQHGPKSAVNVYSDYGASTLHTPRGDRGSAARFFYAAKADADDRLGSKHPTVKPLDVMQWLCRLLTPPGGTVLDPFAGTGTTGEAAWREGFRAVLIEREPAYQDDIRRRMALCLAGPDERAREGLKASGRARDESDLPLFGGTP